MRPPKKQLFELSGRDVALAFAIGVIGFVFSTRTWLLFLSGLDVVLGCLMYYIVLYATLLVFSRMKLIVFAPKIGNVRGTVGLVLLTFALFVTVNWENPYVQYITTGSFGGASPILFQAEDGVAWLFVTQVLGVLGIVDIEVARIFAFSIVPALVALVGLSLIGGRVKLNAFA
ncbi:MAG: hypothetical protein WCC94_02960 [Candidatus Bathyarchaeia archaeon]